MLWQSQSAAAADDDPAGSAGVAAGTAGLPFRAAAARPFRQRNRPHPLPRTVKPRNQSDFPVGPGGLILAPASKAVFSVEHVARRSSCTGNESMSCGHSDVADDGAHFTGSSFSPMMPQAINARQRSRKVVVDSPKRTIPTTAVPTVPMPVQTA